jgi:hypothetical protein
MIGDAENRCGLGVGGVSCRIALLRLLAGPSTDLRRAAAQTVPARPNIVFILTDDTRKYVEYSGGVREPYDLDPDPHERTNQYPSPVVDSLAARLQALKSSAGDTCFAVEHGP